MYYDTPTVGVSRENATHKLTHKLKEVTPAQNAGRKQKKRTKMAPLCPICISFGNFLRRCVRVNGVIRLDIYTCAQRSYGRDNVHDRDGL